jgi:hypothetical protein
MSKRKKSDDSKLADAADARAKEVNLSPEDAPKVLVDQLQDATVKAKQSGASDDIIRRMEKQLNQLAGIVEKQNATIAQLQSAQLTPARKLTSAMPVYPLCPVCRQVLTACKGMHTYARVLPQLPESIDNFKRGHHQRPALLRLLQRAERELPRDHEHGLALRGRRAAAPVQPGQAARQHPRPAHGGGDARVASAGLERRPSFVHRGQPQLS